MANDIVNIV